MLSFESSLKKVITPITTFIALLLFSQVSSASQNDVAINKINHAIQQKLDFYNKTFSEIQFVHLKNGEWEKSLQALELFIGYQATNLDYEHPADVREDLLFVTVEKIRLMLINKVTSSYLFKTGQAPAASRKHICVLTLDPATTVLNNFVATRHFIDIPDKTLSSLPEEKYLDKEQQLDFIIDHEAFHCIDTFYFGGIPMSDRAFSTHYDCYKRESQADMFAIAMNIKRNKKFTPYLNNIIAMRGMTLLNGELQHDSVDAMQLVLSMDLPELVNSHAEQLFRTTKQRYKSISPSYDDYIRYRVAAINAIQHLGVQVNEREEPLYPLNASVDKTLLNKLVHRTIDTYQQYTGKKYRVTEN